MIRIHTWFCCCSSLTFSAYLMSEFTRSVRSLYWMVNSPFFFIHCSTYKHRLFKGNDMCIICWWTLVISFVSYEKHKIRVTCFSRALFSSLATGIWNPSAHPSFLRRSSICLTIFYKKTSFVFFPYCVVFSFLTSYHGYVTSSISCSYKEMYNMKPKTVVLEIINMYIVLWSISKN